MSASRRPPPPPCPARALARRLRGTAIGLTERLAKLEAAAPGGEVGAEGGGVAGGEGKDGAPGRPAAKLADVLAPRGVATSINDFSPLKVITVP